jgi:Flp pilus assembly pilin Flp
VLTGERSLFHRIWRAEHGASESGQTTTEYAVVLAVLLIAAGAIVLTLEASIESFIEQVGDKIGTILFS